MSKPKAPASPDPKVTAAAQTGTNVSTAIANAMLNNVNQVTPEGSLTYDQTGSYSWTDPSSGETYDIPTFTQTQTLSESQQAIADQQNAANLNLSTLANDQSAFLQDYMAEPFSYTPGEYESWAGGLYNDLNSQNNQRQQEDLQTRLANQGIGYGTEAYDRAMGGLTDSQGNQRNQFMLNAYNTGLNTALTERNQPINEIGALLGTGQVSQPNFTNTSMGNIPTTDYAGIVQQDYANRAGVYNSQMGQYNSIMGGLLGFGGAIGGAMLSDKRAKKNIHKVGKLKGENLYEYEYKESTGITGKHIGVMAQEAEKKHPEAVVERPDGYKSVNYGVLFGTGKAA